MTIPQRKKILVSGASIAGPTAAYWLHRYGFDVTVVERAPVVRGGGYAIDIRGTAIGVVERMGLLTELKKAHIHTADIHFMAADGTTLRTVKPEELTGGVEGYDLELPRGTLSEMLYEASKHTVEYRFNESIESLDDASDGVYVTFKAGGREKFDLVIGADGLHSNTRKLAFGPEEQFLHYLGYTFTGFTMPNIFGLSHGAAFYSAVNRMAALYAVKQSETIHGFFTIACENPSVEELSSADLQRQIMRKRYSSDGWVIPKMLEAFETADDIYFDSVSQIRMPCWSKGRVALIGDAAAAPSFMTGQGSSVALVAAYVLAGELASHANHQDGFAAYERVAREFVDRNQEAASYRDWQFIPNTPVEAEALKNRLKTMEFGKPDEKTKRMREAHVCLNLPDYTDLEIVRRVTTEA